MICEICEYCERYYKGKNRKYACLKMAFCENPKLPKDGYVRGKPHKWIETYRLSLKIVTKPRWCPIKTSEETK